jgi:hypothetical protein
MAETHWGVLHFPEDFRKAVCQLRARGHLTSVEERHGHVASDRHCVPIEMGAIQSLVRLMCISREM